MKKITKWLPDTCKCEIHYEWDTEMPELEVVPKVVSPCPLHQGSVAQVFNLVYEENSSKNLAVGRLLENDVFGETLTEGEREIRRFKRGKDVRWSFDENRKVELELIGFTSQERSLAQTELGKVGKIQGKYLIK